MKHFLRFILLVGLLVSLFGLSVISIAATPELCSASNIGGTAELPTGCPFIAPFDIMYIIDGLPSGTTIQCVPKFDGFAGITRTPGGPLGGETEQFQATLTFDMTGTGTLAGWHRSIPISTTCEFNAAPRITGTSPQSIVLDFSQMQGQITGDPDFDLLRITAGTNFGMPSPGHVTLTKLQSGEWNVDSYFDITYRIDFVGHPGGAVSGLSGSTTATIRWQQGVTAPDNCIATDASGTVDLPASCPFRAPYDVMYIQNGLSLGDTIKCVPVFDSFTGIIRTPGGPLGGETEQFMATLTLKMAGTGTLSTFTSTLPVHPLVSFAAGTRFPGTSPQNFPLDCLQLQGQITGDPDFDLLRITAGSGFGMPSPGQATLTKLPSGDWNVDSFFDITYRIDFIGAPGGSLAGKSGSTTGTIRWQQGVLMTVQQDPINLLHTGLYLNDRLTPADRLVNDYQRYFVAAGEKYIPTAVLRNTSSSSASTTLYCHIYGQNDSNRIIIAYDDSQSVQMGPYAQTTVRLPQCIFDNTSGEGNYYMSWRKGDGIPVDPVPIRKGYCFLINFKITPKAEGGFTISKSVLNLKNHPCPYVVEFFWDDHGTNSEIKDGNFIGGKEGSTDPSGEIKIEVDWNPPPGEYCIFARCTIQGKTIVESINDFKVKKKPAGPKPPPPPPPPPPPFPPPWPPFPGGWWVLPVPIAPSASCTDTMKIVIVADSSAWPAFLSKDTLFYPCLGSPRDTMWLMVWVPDGTMEKNQKVSNYAGISDTSRYTVVILDSAGVVTGSSTYYVMKADGAPTIMQYQASSGWNLLSLPLTVDDGRKSVLFPAALSNAFKYQGGYIAADTLFNGIGYWLKLGTSDPVSISGYYNLLDTVHVDLGWNLIGTISDTVYTSSIVQEPAAIVASNYWYFDGGYKLATRLEPGKGYWIKTSSVGELILSYSSWSKTATIPFAELKEKFNSITVSDALSNKQTLYFGVNTDKQFNLDFYSMPPLAPAEMFDVRFSSQRMLEVHPSDLKGSVEFPISVRAGVSPYSVSWQINNSRGARYSVEFNGTNKSFTSKILDDKGTMVVQDLSRFTLSVENGKYIPSEFAIRQSYPNPFNPVSTIEFDLPTSGSVQLKVFNVLGQEVTLLVDNVTYSAGSYSVRFDASQFASGTYFYRLNVYSQTGELVFQSTQKALLVR